MSTRSVDRSAVARGIDRSAVTREKACVGLCSFTFADGRCCRTPRSATHPHFCYFHARKEAQAQAADEIGRDISYFFSGHYLSACDLSSAFGRLFAGVVQGQIKPKTTSTLAYLGQTLVQTIQLSQHEYMRSLGPIAWRDAVCSSVNDNSDRLSGDSDQDENQDAHEDERQDDNHGEDHDEKQYEEQDSAPKIAISS